MKGHIYIKKKVDNQLLGGESVADVLGRCSKMLRSEEQHSLCALRTFS
jgi:hypothetical protein